MRFISNGDFLFPFHGVSYWAQHVYMWSFERGAANPDGIMRLPQRLLDAAVFALVGNVGFGYFYLVTSLMIAFGAFYWFAVTVLGASRKSVALWGALFFALNPIFLGNVSKIGLVLAAAMLPVMIAALHQTFAHKRLLFLLLWIIGFNISLLHPFTATVNVVVSSIYAVYLGRQHLTWLRDRLWPLLILGTGAILLHAYCLLPLASLGTVSKDALSDTVNSTPVDYTSLVDVANTGDIFTGLSLAKGVFKDYEFYGARTWPLYFLGVFMFYALLLGAYIASEKRLKADQRRWFVILFALFLGLLALATASFLYIDVFIKWLIGLPGGWMFRSPLKWQLYMPLPLAGALVIALLELRTGWRRRLLYIGLGLSFVCMNGYLFSQIGHRLLAPRTVTTFAGLMQQDLQYKSLLMVTADRCLAFARDNPAVATELNQVLISKQVQVKRVSSRDLDRTLLGQYDFILGCAGTMNEQSLTKQYSFRRINSFANGTYELYQNNQAPAFATALAQPFVLDAAGQLGGKYALSSVVLQQPLVTVAGPGDGDEVRGIQDIFDRLTAANIGDGQLEVKVKPLISGPQVLYTMPGMRTLYYAQQDNALTVSAAPQKGLRQLVANEPLPINVDDELTIRYLDATVSRRNAITNGSFENGLWQKTVGDCNAYDRQPDIGMRAVTPAQGGKVALELFARKHIACTSPAAIAVREGEHYLLSFDYQTNGGRYGGYHAGFNNPQQSSTSGRLPDTKGAWQTMTTEIVVPAGATELALMIYAYPSATIGSTGVARYDNFSLVGIPKITNQFFLVSGNKTESTVPVVTSQTINPTKHLVQIEGARAPFYISTKETYHNKWLLQSEATTQGTRQLSSFQPIAAEHLRLNGSMNGWRIDPTALCSKTPEACVIHPDGSYDIRLAMTFAPQRWFYIGSVVSAVALVGIAGYAAVDLIRGNRKRGRR